LDVVKDHGLYADLLISAKGRQQLPALLLRPAQLLDLPHQLLLLRPARRSPNPRVQRNHLLCLAVKALLALLGADDRGAVQLVVPAQELALQLVDQPHHPQPLPETAPLLHCPAHRIDAHQHCHADLCAVQLTLRYLDIQEEI
jgi:hypothetical protein